MATTTDTATRDDGPLPLWYSDWAVKNATIAYCVEDARGDLVGFLCGNCARRGADGRPPASMILFNEENCEECGADIGN